MFRFDASVLKRSMQGSSVVRLNQRQPKIPNNAEFLTPAQVGEIFQVKEMTVRLWLRRKLIRGVKIGHSWRISRVAVDEFKTGGGAC